MTLMEVTKCFVNKEVLNLTIRMDGGKIYSFCLNNHVVVFFEGIPSCFV